jgi:hypothetical protein
MGGDPPGLVLRRGLIEAFGGGDVIAIPAFPLSRVTGCEPPAQLIVEETGKQARLLGMGAIAPTHAALAETLLHPVPQILVYDGFVLAGIGLVLVDGLTEVSSVSENLVKSPAGEGLPTEWDAGIAYPALAPVSA